MLTVIGLQNISTTGVMFNDIGTASKKGISCINLHTVTVCMNKALL